MGGYGSGYQGHKKPVVEDCLTLSISEMMAKGALVPGKIYAGQWCWRYPGHEPLAWLSYVADMRSVDAATLRLMGTVDGAGVDYVIRLVWTTPHFGGKRWWFLCPIALMQGGWPRQVAKLHLPRGGRYFASRTAYDLTYTSCQESGKYDALFAHIAREMGTTTAQARRAMTAMVDD